MWCGGDGIIAEYEGRTWSMLRVDLGQIRAMCSAQQGGVWVTSDTGIHRFLEGSWVSNAGEEGLADPQIRDLLLSRSGDVCRSRGLPSQVRTETPFVADDEVRARRVVVFLGRDNAWARRSDQGQDRPENPLHGFAFRC